MPVGGWLKGGEPLPRPARTGLTHATGPPTLVLPPRLVEIILGRHRSWGQVYFVVVIGKMSSLLQDLESHFGYDAFLPGQEEVMERLMEELTFHEKK